MDSVEMILSYVAKAREAQAKIAAYTQEAVDDMVRSVAWEVYADDNIAQLARLAVEETNMGRIEDKVLKHKNKVLGALDEALRGKTVGLIERNEETGISKYAKPIGVIGALTPVTNPTATPASNAIYILKGRNAVIFAPHPKAKKATALAVSFMRNGLKRVGAPADLIQVIEEPSLELTGELMRQVDLIVATGGSPMVKAAYSSGKPAYGVGPGNACQIVAEDADLKDVASKVASSKTFDNATSCSSENSLVIQNDVYDALLECFKKQGGYLLDHQAKDRLCAHMWKTNAKGKVTINAQIVARDAKTIAEGAGISVPENTKFLIVEGDMPLENDHFSGEKLSPVLTVYRYGSFEEGVEILTRLTDHTGLGHSCGIHTFNREYIDYLGQHMKSSRIMVRQGQAGGNGGTFENGMPSTTSLGCGTWGNNIISENITWKHFINVTWLSEPIANHRPSDEQMWGDFFKTYKK